MNALRLALGAVIVGLTASGCFGNEEDEGESEQLRDGAIGRQDAGVPHSPEEDPRVAVIESNYKNPATLQIFDLNNQAFIPDAIYNPVMPAQDSVVRITTNGGKFCVLNRGVKAGDTIRCYSRSGDSYGGPVNVGPFANPQDVVVPGAYVSKEGSDDQWTGFATLYETGELVELDLAGCMVTNRFDLTPYSDDDGDRFPTPSPIVWAGGKWGERLFIGLQDLHSDYSANTNGKLAVWDFRNGGLQPNAIPLITWNPFSARYNSLGDRILVASAGTYFTKDARGGVESVDPDTGATEVLFTDAELGGSPGEITLSNDFGFVVSSYYDAAADVYRSAVRRFNLQTGELDPDPFYEGIGIASIVWAHGFNLLLVGERNPAGFGIMLLDGDGTVVAGPITGGMPPYSIAAY